MLSLQAAQAALYYRVANLLLRLHRFEAAANAYGWVLRVQPGDPHVRFHRAWCLLAVPGRRLEGITEFQSLLRESPSEAGFFLLGGGLQQEGRHEEAVQAFQEAIRLDDSGSRDLYYNLGVSLTTLRRLEESVEAYEAAAHLSPSDWETWGALGGTLAELGRWKEAVPCQERAMRLAPSVVHAIDLASTLYELNRLEDAERAVREALALDPRSIDARESLAHVLAGLERNDEAVTLAREICDLHPERLSSRVVLAGVLGEAGRLDEALDEARTAVDLAPSDPRAHGTIGAIYAKRNDGAASLVAFEQMSTCLGPDLDRLPSSPWAWCSAGRGAALSLLGRHDEAIAAFEHLLRADAMFFERWPEAARHYQHSLRETGRIPKDPPT